MTRVGFPSSHQAPDRAQTKSTPVGESGPSGGLGDPGFPVPLGRNRRMEEAMAAPTQNEGQVEAPVTRHLGTKCHCYSTPGLDDRPEWPTVPASRFEFWRRAVYTVTAAATAIGKGW